MEGVGKQTRVMNSALRELFPRSPEFILDCMQGKLQLSFGPYYNTDLQN
jgi:hypothetical protein